MCVELSPFLISNGDGCRFISAVRAPGTVGGGTRVEVAPPILYFFGSTCYPEEYALSFCAHAYVSMPAHGSRSGRIGQDVPARSQSTNGKEKENGSRGGVEGGMAIQSMDKFQV